MISYLEAKDITFDIFYQALKNQSNSILGYVPKVWWPGVEEFKPEQDLFHVRPSFQTIDTMQRAFVKCADGSRLYSSEGIAIFEINSPTCLSNSKRNAIKLAQEIRKAFRVSQESSIWYRKENIKDDYPKDNFLRTTVNVEFYFQEVQ